MTKTLEIRYQDGRRWILVACKADVTVARANTVHAVAHLDEETIGASCRIDRRHTGRRPQRIVASEDPSLVTCQRCRRRLEQEVSS